MDSDKADRFRALQRRFLASAFEQIDRVQELIARAFEGPNDRGECRKIVHNLKGAGGSYGYPRVSEIARELEERVLAGGGPGDLGPLAHALREELRRLGAADVAEG